MEDYSILLSGLEYKLRKVIDIKSKLQNEVDELKKELEFLCEENRILKDMNKRLKTDNNISEISVGIEKHKNSKQVKLMINEYLREIDRCIAFLNTHN